MLAGSFDTIREDSEVDGVSFGGGGCWSSNRAGGRYLCACWSHNE